MKQLALSLSLILHHRKIKKDALPDAQVRLKNDSDQMIIVNGRMMLVPAGSPPRIKEIVFSITGPPGSINLKGISVNAGAAEIEHFVNLLPGEYIEKVYELKEYFYYDKPGHYDIRATYYNEGDHVVLGNKSWKGKLVSNEEYFEII